MSSRKRLSGCCWMLHLMFFFSVGLLVLVTAPVSDAAFVNGKIAFWSDRDGNTEIYSMDADGSGQTNLTNNSYNDQDPAWSPDGTKIAFETNRDGNTEVYSMNADGGGQTKLTNNPYSDQDPAWSPDGTKIAFEAGGRARGDSEVYVISSDGGLQTNLTQTSNFDGAPAWSPDGTKIAFKTLRTGDYEIFVMNANGSGQTNLTNHSYGDEGPAWSPDGTKIAFESNRDGSFEIYSMNADGSGQTRLTDSPDGDGSPSWAAIFSPINTTPPGISGTPAAGQRLSCSQGTWRNDPTTYRYEWLRGGSVIGGATSSTYTLVAADRGWEVKCQVTATNDAGSDSSASTTVKVPNDETPARDTVAPATTIDTGPAAVTREINAIFTFHASEVGVGFECRVDARPWGPCGSPEVVYGLMVGGHTFQVRAQDWVGNTGEPASWSWTVDRSAPELKELSLGNIRGERGKKRGKRLRRSHLASISGLMGDDFADIRRVKIKLKIANPSKTSKRGTCVSLSLRTGRRIVGRCKRGFTQVRGAKRWQISLSRRVRSKLRRKDNYRLLIRALDSAGNQKTFGANLRVR